MTDPRPHLVMTDIEALDAYETVRPDPPPVHVPVWDAAADLAQALWTRPKETKRTCALLLP